MTSNSFVPTIRQSSTYSKIKILYEFVALVYKQYSFSDLKNDNDIITLWNFSFQLLGEVFKPYNDFLNLQMVPPFCSKPLGREI